MRWSKNDKWNYRVKRKFAFWPINVGQEVRWLEWVNVYQCDYGLRYFGISQWITVEFIDG